jgi:glutamate/tyrosine decarboxylase-like PLP-dependent enzyme
MWMEPSAYGPMPPRFAHLLTGAEHADSWASDGHKWLNVPFDSGYAFTAHPESHFRAMSTNAEYLVESHAARDPMNWGPELSKRARGFSTYAALRELGVKGIEALVDRLCKHAASIVKGAGQLPQTEVLAYPIINQGLLRFLDLIL